MTLVTDIKKQINTTKNATIKKILEKHFNPEANSLSFVFNQIHKKNDRAKDNEWLGKQALGKKGLPETRLIATAFAHAPHAVCDKLLRALTTMDKQQAVDIISDPWSGLVSLSGGFYNIYITAPKKTRLALSKWVANLEPKQVMQVFAGKRGLLGHKDKLIYQRSIDVFTFNEPIAAKDLIQALKKLDSKDLLTLFQTSSFPLSHYTGLVDLFSKISSDETALLLLDLIAPLSDKDLKKLFYGRIVYTSGQEEGDNLMRHISQFSPQVVTKVLYLLHRLPLWDVKNILLSGASDWINPLTPLETAFRTSNQYQPVVQSELAIAFITVLNRDKKLRPLLIKTPRPDSEPFLHLLCRHETLQALAYYLEQPQLPTSHTNNRGESALGIAASLSNKGALSLLKAQPLQHFLLSKEGSPEDKLPLTPQLEQSIKNHPGVLFTRWSEHRTLAHMAILQGHSEALRFFLAHGADANAKDERQLNLLDYAINTEHVEALKVLAAHPKTDFTMLRKDGTLPLPYLLNTADFTIVRGAISNLRAHGGQKVEQSFAAALMQLPKIRLKLDALLQHLDKPVKANALHPQLSDFAAEAKDTFAFFLHHTGELLATSKHPALMQAAFDFVTKELNTLANANAPLEKENARMALMLFLFAMPPEAVTLFVKTLPLNSQQQTQLDLVLCHGLVQPLIFSRFSLQEHERVHEAFSDKAASLTSIASIHFRRSNLTLLPPALLQQLADALPEHELYKVCENRAHPTLIVLALEQELAAHALDDEKIAALFLKLEKELTLFNQDPSPLTQDDLRLMLNMTRAPQIKQAMAAFSATHEKKTILGNRIDALFATYHREEPLMSGSLLRDAYINGAKDLEIIRKARNKPALADLLSIATPDEVRSILNTLQQALKPRFLMDSLLATATDTDKKTPGNHERTLFLYSLGNKTARIALSSLVERAGELSDEAQALGGLTEDGSLNTALPSLAKALSELANALIKSQFESTNPAWTPELDQAFEGMKKSCEAAAVALKNTPARTPQTGLQQRLERLIWEQLERAFPEALKQAYCLLSENEEKEDLILQHTLATHARLKPLQSVFQVPKVTLDEPALAKASALQARDLRKVVTRLNDSLSKGVLNNAGREELLPALTAWQMSLGYLAPASSLLQHLAPVLTTLNPTTLAVLSAQQDTTLVLAEKSASLRAKLRRLANHNPCINDVLDVLTKADTETLASFVTLATLTERHELSRLGHYVLTGKEHDWNRKLLKNSTANHPTPWLRESLTSLADFTANALSIKALITGIFQDEEHSDARLHVFSELIKTHNILPTLDAITLFASSYSTLLTSDLFSPASTTFVLTFSALMQQSDARLQTKVLASLSAELIMHLVEHCLSGISSNDLERASSCKALLTRLCQQASSSDEARFLLIKKRLGQQDFSLLGEDSLIALAKEVLNEKTGLDDATFDGVWIQRLLTSPRFVAASNPETLQRLTERYRALSLTLKQDEFERLTAFIAGKLCFADQHRDAFSRWQQELLANPKAKARLLAKQGRLLTFRADDSIRALFNQLEDNCLEARKTEPELAETALNNLYTHHNQQLAGLRSDVLFRMADFIYQRAMRGKGDIPKNKNPLLAWLEQHLPHYNFQQAELGRKTQVFFYNEAGEKIGYLDESNYAFVLRNDEPVPLLELDGWLEGAVLYDENRLRLGVLTASGQLKRENLFQNHTTALLVAKMPIDQLQKSPAAFHLLLKDIFIENSFEILFKEIDSEEKSTWVQEQLAQYLKKEKKTVSAELMVSFVAHQPIESLLETLSNSANPLNAERLFTAILANETQRAALFAHRASPLITEFLKKANAETLLSDYLLQHYNQSWFNEGLCLFAAYAREIPKRDLLSQALERLHACVLTKTLTQTTFDGIVSTFLSTEAIAKTVLDGFLADSPQLDVQKIRSQHSDKVARFFTKQHITPVIKTLNEKKSWEKSAQYRLLLSVCNAEHENLFPHKEARSAETRLWNTEDLQNMASFAIRHANTPNPHDKKGAIGQCLLGEVVFRFASSGQTALFYQKNGELDARVAGYYLKRSTMNALASRFYLINCAKETIAKLRAAVKKWFGDNKEDDSGLEELKGNHAILDWKALARESWAHTHSTQLPLIAAFLINYQGASAPLLNLVHDIITHCGSFKKNDLVHHISQIMAHYPHRDVSHVIFKALEEAAIGNPSLIDKTVFKNMSRFHAHAHLPGNKLLETRQEERELLTHFGQQQHYALTRHCAKILYKPVTWGRFFSKCCGAKSKEDEVINQQFGGALREARIEDELQRAQSDRTFKLQKALKRWWHYRLRGFKKPTGMVRFCDDESPYIHPGKMPEKVTTPDMGEQPIGMEPPSPGNQKRTKERYKAFFSKDEPQQETPKKATPHLPKGPGISKFGLFPKVKKVLETQMPEDTPQMAAGF